MKTKAILLTCLIFTVATVNAFAAIDVRDRTADLKIFMPDGKQIIVTKDKPLPTIPDGSTITILSGSAVIATTGKSTVSVSIGNYTVNVGEDSKVNLVLNEDKTVGATIILGRADVIRKAETYTSAIPPATIELDATGSDVQDISPTH